MSDDEYPWRPQDKEGAAAEDITFLNQLRGDQIAPSERARRKIGDNIDDLALAIARVPRLCGGNIGEVRFKGQDYLYELIRTELTWPEYPLAPYDPFNFKREVSVCLIEEMILSGRKARRRATRRRATKRKK